MLLIILGGKYLNQNLEIEFKNELTEEEYFLLVKKEFEGLSHSKHMTFQTNYYFDTIDQELKKQGAILRIRVTDSFSELTFKVPSGAFLMETNYPLSDSDVKAILHLKEMKLTNYITSPDSIPELDDISKETTFSLFNQFETQRFEKQIRQQVIVLDQTTFQNGVVDYELEVESQDAENGETFFKNYLKEHHILRSPSLPKIARAEQNKQPFV